MRLVHHIQSGHQAEIGQAVVPLSKLLSAPLKKTEASVVRVYDDYVDIIESQSGHLKGNLRVLVYLDDAGTTSNGGKLAQNTL